jgi:zinc protease
MLDNGLEVLYYHDDRIQKIELTLEFKADYLYDPEDKQGLSNFVAQLLLKGTSKYTAAQLADLIESKGMGISSSSGFIALSMLSKDFKCGMELLTMIVSDALFAENAVEQVNHKIAIDIADYWDQPYQFAGALIRKDIYAGHPYSKSVLGTRESLDKITRADLIENYKQFITPSGAHLALVGDFSGYDLKQVLEQTLGKWSGPRVQEVNFPQLSRSNHHAITHVINRDQVILAFAGLSIERTNPDYDKLLLFDQIFGGGVLGAMSSRLFQVREQTGLFYTIAGSALAGADKQPGLVLVKTIVSLERLHEAEKAIKDVMASAAASITQEELLQAKRALINSLVDHFASYRQMVSTFLALRRFDLPIDYFDKRADQLQAIQLPAVQEAAARVLVPDAMITVKIGRV